MTDAPSDSSAENPAAVEEELAQLRADLTALQDQVDGLSTMTVHPGAEDSTRSASKPLATATTSSPEPPAPPPVARTGRAWRTMTAEQAAEAWRTLFDFVDWMTDRYDLHDSLPSCWYRHGCFVEELHALHLAWIGAYLHPSARPTDPATWQELQHRALTRLRDADRLGCIAGTHRESPRSITDERSADRAARAAYADADSHRRPATAPAPRPATAHDDQAARLDAIHADDRDSAGTDAGPRSLRSESRCEAPPS